MLHFSKTARNFFIILSLRQVNNISLHMNLVSQLAALVCTIGVHGNIGNSKQSFIAIYRQEHDDKTILDVTFLQNGSKFFHNTFPAQSKQYFLTHEPSQPIGRAGLSAWRP